MSSNKALVKNAEYWRDRFLNLEQVTHDNAQDLIERVERAYKLAKKEIDAAALTYIWQFADAEGLDTLKAKEILEGDELEAFKLSVEEYIKYAEQNAEHFNPDVEKMLQEASLKYRFSRLEATNHIVAAEVAKLKGTESALTEQMLADSYIDRYYRTAFELFKGQGVGTSFEMVDINNLRNILDKPWTTDGTNFSTRIWQSQVKLTNQLTEELFAASANGESYAATAKRLAESMESSLINSRRVINTESAYFSSRAQNDCYKKLGGEQYQIISTLDSKSCSICQSMDLKIFDLDDFVAGVTAPPFHPNCRDTTRPYFDDEEVIGTRTARGEDGKTYRVPANMSYEQWREKYNINPIYGSASDELDQGAIIQIAQDSKRAASSIKSTEIKKAKPIKIDFGKKLKKDYPEWVLNEVEPLYDKADDRIKRAFNACAPKMHCSRIKAADDDICYISPKRKGATGEVHINIYKAAEGSVWENPWSDFAHEHGHNMDFILNQLVGTGKGNKSISTTYKRGKLRKELSKDFDNIIKDFKLNNPDLEAEGITSDADICFELCFDLSTSLGKKDRVDISDMFAAQLQNRFALDPDYMEGNGMIDWSYPLGTGHEFGYFVLDPTNIEQEFFAEVMDASVTNPDSLRMIKEYFPRGYAVVNEILDLVE